MKMRHQQVLRAVCIALLAAGSLYWAACSTSTTPSGDGTVSIYMVDSPAPYDSVVVFVTRVEVRTTGSDTISDWSEVRGDSVRFDLLVLRNGARGVLGSHVLVPGHYTQIRLIVGAGSYVVDGGVKHALTIPSGMESGIKLNHDFDIVAGQTYELLLDFDAGRSIHMTGNGKYMMNPVIRVSAIAATGSVKGVISPASAKALVWATMGVDTVETLADPLTGAFVLPGLLSGTIAIHCAPENTSFRDTTITGIPIVNMQQTDIGTVTLRLQ